MEGDCFSSGLWGQGDGEMINESQKCCSRWTVNATGLRTRSENVTLRYMQAVCPKAGSSSPALSQPESSRRSWWSCSRYFMACQKKPCEKRHTDLSSSLFQLFAHLCPWKTESREVPHPLLSSQQQVHKLRSFREPLGCLSLILKMQIGSNREDFGFPEVKSNVLSTVASTLN